MNFDLNINNYNQEELLDLFNLREPYDMQMVETNISSMRENIINNKSLDLNSIRDTLNFLTKAKSKLEDFSTSKKELSLEERRYNVNTKLTSVPLLKNSGEYAIQDRENTLYSSSLPSQFFPGIINPLKKRVRNTNLSIDSKFRPNYYTTSSSNFVIYPHQNLTNVLSLKLNAIELPLSYFVISASLGNNFFHIDIEEDNSSTMLVIPDGNYTDESFENILNHKLSYETGLVKNIVFKINKLNERTGSYQMLVGISDNYEDEFNFTLDFQKSKSGINDKTIPLPMKIGWIMGFRNGKYENNYNYISEGQIDLKGPKYIYLCIDDYNDNWNNSFYGILNNSLINKNILARISLNGEPFGNLSQRNLIITTEPREYFGPVNLNSFNIQLLDEYGRYLDLNNMDFSFCISLQIQYDL